MYASSGDTGIYRYQNIIHSFAGPNSFQISFLFISANSADPDANQCTLWHFICISLFAKVPVYKGLIDVLIYLIFSYNPNRGPNRSVHVYRE